MSREIKFRAWDGKEMHYQVCINHNQKAIKYGYRSTDWVVDANAGVPMQFTGLLDKNGKEIFEGDIVEYIERLPVFPEKRIAVVQFIGGNADYANNFLISPFVNIGSFNYETNCITGVMNNPAESVIIGNIYQNPELLGGKND